MSLVAHLRKKFKSHTPTVQDIVASMSDALLVQKYHEHQKLHQVAIAKFAAKRLGIREARSVVNA